MKKLVVKGGNKLKGVINISGAKNATLPIFVASLLTKEKLILQNVPHVSDIASMVDLLATLGVKLTFDASKETGCCRGRTVILDGGGVDSFIAPYDIVRKMRASVLVLGPLLARFGKAKVSLPGGCAIGTRPVDIHLSAFEAMGAKINIEKGYINADTKDGLKGANVDFRFPSVGATQNVMMAATLAKGTTVITNVAKEPEVVDLANCLNGMGAKITGAGTSIITIEGVKELKEYTHCILGDRIEAATYVIAATMTDGEIILNGLDIFATFGKTIDAFEDAGVKFEKLSDTSVKVSRKSNGIKPTKIMTDIFPGFPTDVQAQFMTLMLMADGESIISENIFENRFMHVPELQRLGANIEANGSIAKVKGGEELIGAEVMATDLRASVSLVLAGLVSKGTTVINRIYHLERGYDNLTEKLCRCGADVETVYYADEEE
jgi:UDP-N-acetylglucosamine 1-carboxyvinyltransferase